MHLSVQRKLTAFHKVQRKQGQKNLLHENENPKDTLSPMRQPAELKVWGCAGVFSPNNYVPAYHHTYNFAPFYKPSTVPEYQQLHYQDDQNLCTSALSSPYLLFSSIYMYIFLLLLTITVLISLFYSVAVVLQITILYADAYVTNILYSFTNCT